MQPTASWKQATALNLLYSLLLAIVSQYALNWQLVAPFKGKAH
jgi:hypothetical protein